MQAHLEDLAEKDVTKKSDAAREAFLAELERDSKKDSKGGSDNLKHAREKSKEKKKSKEFRKAKDSKVVCHFTTRSLGSRFCCFCNLVVLGDL